MTGLLFCSLDWLTGKLFNREREDDAVDGWSFVAIDRIGAQLEKRQWYLMVRSWRARPQSGFVRENGFDFFSQTTPRPGAIAEKRRIAWHWHVHPARAFSRWIPECFGPELALATPLAENRWNRLRTGQASIGAVAANTPTSSARTKLVGAACALCPNSGAVFTTPNSLILAEYCFIRMYFPLIVC
jgi:hypothetical protein